MRCPDHSVDLTASADGAHRCTRCQGELHSASGLDALAPGVLARLTIEAREKSGAFARLRPCPSCAATMAPLRIDPLDAWIERCPACELYWLDSQDRRTLVMLERREARERAMQTLSPSERQDFAHAVAESVQVDTGPRLSPVQQLLAVIGIPQVVRRSSNRVPYATWSIALLLIAVHLLARAAPERFGTEALAYFSTAPSAWSAVTATVTHFGWLHLLGNLAFLLTFGDALEQRLPRWVLLGAFFLLSPLGIWVEAAFAHSATEIGGASAGVALLMGACFVLQRRARVVIAFVHVQLVPLPMLLFAAFELGYQVAMASVGEPGVAWIAHVTGMVLGILVGLAASMRTGEAAAPTAG